MTNITLGYLGKGSVFGDIDVVLKRNYQYTLRSDAQGCSAYFLKTSAFHEYFGFYKNSFQQMTRACLEQDLRLMKQLATVTYGMWAKGKSC